MWIVYALRGKDGGTWSRHEVGALGSSFALPEFGGKTTTLRYVLIDLLSRTAVAIE